MRTLDDIRTMLLHDSINYSLVMQMTEEELREADNYDDYGEYNRYMNYLARKYDI